MRTARKDRESVRAETITFPATPDEKKKIQERADRMGITMSALIRMVMNDYLKNE